MIAGLILLAAAPCTAMVFVWSRLTNGDPLFTLSQVALNDTIMVFAFAPLVGLLLGLSSITVPWSTLVTSVLLYIVIPKGFFPLQDTGVIQAVSEASQSVSFPAMAERQHAGDGACGHAQVGCGNRHRLANVGTHLEGEVGGGGEQRRPA